MATPHERMHCSIIAMLELLNSFIRKGWIVKSRDCNTLLGNAQASNPLVRIGKHFFKINSSITSSEGKRPTLTFGFLILNVCIVFRLWRDQKIEQSDAELQRFTKFEDRPTLTFTICGFRSSATSAYPECTNGRNGGKRTIWGGFICFHYVQCGHSLPFWIWRKMDCTISQSSPAWAKWNQQTTKCGRIHNTDSSSIS